MPFDNIKSHKKPGFHPLFRGYIFWKATRGGDQIDSPAVLGLRKVNVTPYGFNKMCMNKELIKDKIYQ